MPRICLHNLIQNDMEISSKRLIRRHIETTFILWESGVIFILIRFSKVVYANRKVPDEAPHFAASPLVLFCLPMSYKRTPGLYGLSPENNKSFSF